jgi:tetratricopeptide (TPR) repeat protein
VASAALALGVGLHLILKKCDEPGKVLINLAMSAVLTTGVVWFVRWRLSHLSEGLSLENVGNAIFVLASVVVLGLVLTVVWGSNLCNFFISPLTNLLDGGHELPDQKPFYSIAMARRNRGRTDEAIEEVRRQLERFPNDFEGVLLLARIQAEDLADLDAAATTLGEFCDGPNPPPAQVAAAYTQLADWELKLHSDVAAARAALQRIITHFPDTELALQAEQRIAHLVDTEQVLQTRRNPQQIGLAAGVANVGLLDSTDFLKPKEVEPGRLAAVYVKHLAEHPHDTEVREKLALIYGRDYQRLDLATMELAQLVNEPKHKPKEVAHWLNLLATLQIELGADLATVQGTLGKIVERYPNLPVADLAQRRLERLENEFKGLRQSENVKLGAYEQNVGLKYGRPEKR